MEGPPNSYKLVDSVNNMQGRSFLIDGTCIAYCGQQSIIDAVVVDIVDKSDSNTLLALWWQSTMLEVKRRSIG